MAKIVFILGAGASKSAGAPLMSGFMDEVELLVNHHDPEDRTAWELVRRGQIELRRAHSKAKLDLDNLETVYSAIEMATLCGRLGTLQEVEVTALPAAFRRVISRTLELKIKFPTDGLSLEAPRDYHKLGELIRQMYAKKLECSVITFNYDTCVEAGLRDQGLYEFYSLDEKRSGSSVPVLKLHGSLNWYAANSGSNVQYYFPQSYRVMPFVDDRSYAPIEWSRMLTSNTTGLNENSIFPFIVPPTWSKGSHYDAINRVWRAAAQELADCEILIIIGYSLPITDEFFRHLFAVSTISDTKIYKIIVCDPDPSGVVMQRYRDMLGQMTEPRFCPIKAKFTDALPHLSNYLLNGKELNCN